MSLQSLRTFKVDPVLNYYFSFVAQYLVVKKNILFFFFSSLDPGVKKIRIRACSKTYSELFFNQIRIHTRFPNLWPDKILYLLSSDMLNVLLIEYIEI